MSDPSDSSHDIVNPRRAPRLAVRCQVRAEALGRHFATSTEDLGIHGCQLVAPLSLPRGLPLRLVLSYPSLPESLHASGQIAWTSLQAPWRHGVAFHEGSLPAAERWVARLLAIHPDLASPAAVPPRLEAASRLHLGEPPRHMVDFTLDELAVLRLVRAGTNAGALRHRLGADWQASLRALFSLISRRLVTLDAAEAGHPLSWAASLGVVEWARPMDRLDPSDRAAPLGRLRTGPAKAALEG